MTNKEDFVDQPEYWRIHLPDWQDINKKIMAEFAEHRDAPERQSHFFHGRFENLYIGSDKMPSINPLLDAAAKNAAKILQRSVSSLKYGYWFNLMYPGHVTSWHTHDEDDELLSCVYYLDVPPDSGNLQLRLSDGIASIVPENGMFVFFSPTLDHCVEKNKSDRPRLSVAINFGPSSELR